MDTSAYILITLAALAAAGAFVLALFSLQASRLTEALFDAAECALAARRQRRAEMRPQATRRADGPRAVEAPARTSLPALSLVAHGDRAAA